ncbi:hypothetical protein [Candidatus Neomicrothrix sp.]|uniref:hypothetical protein n=1 Tax=Candidatus Neomicrothrix sp. TaxID=2719034 RepID=UPI001B43AA30|nr:hypothetical protein [Candidatus Microthrix sp.]MBP6136569.1 hypothetical protein [Candidatus Microthrix sp.]MBP6151608.1 hypothetical protein [Candidatus Microthrix sp.]
MTTEPKVDPIDELAELRSDYLALGVLLALAEGSAAAAIARERRIMRARLAEIEKPAEGTKVDEVAAKRESKATVAAVPARRRQPR